MPGILPDDWRDRPCPICEQGSYQTREECCVALDGPFVGLPCWYVLAEAYESNELSLVEAAEWAEGEGL